MSQQESSSVNVRMKGRPQEAVSCAIYTCQCSDVQEALWHSHREQRDACKAFVASQREQGWRALPSRYIDSDSAQRTMKKPSLRRLLAHIQEGMIRVVVVYRLEHLSVNLMELAKIIEQLYEYKVCLVSLSQQVNTNEPAGRLAISLLLSFAKTQAKGAQLPKPAEYEKFLHNSQQARGVFRYKMRFLPLAPERDRAFLSWARKGFRFRKPAASQTMPVHPVDAA